MSVFLERPHEEERRKKEFIYLLYLLELFLCRKKNNFKIKKMCVAHNSVFLNK